MPKFVDLSGEKFGRWLVLERTSDHVTKSGNHFTQYRCVCECGIEKDVTANSLKSGRSVSCGCFARERSSEVCRDLFMTHGETKGRLYQIYAGIKKRCLNPNAYNYADYGGRGISMCEEWLHNWCSFRDWALKNGYADNLSIDRIDVNGNYTPDNCRWVGRVAQANNRRSNRYITYRGESRTIAEWANELNIPYKRLHRWIQKGKTLDEIMAN